MVFLKTYWRWVHRGGQNSSSVFKSAENRVRISNGSRRNSSISVRVASFTVIKIIIIVIIHTHTDRLLLLLKFVEFDDDVALLLSAVGLDMGTQTDTLNTVKSKRR